MRKLLLALTLTTFTLFSQENTAKKDSLLWRKVAFSSANVTAYLYTNYHNSQRLFKDYPYSPFHFTNDIKTWKGMDKMIHGYITSKYAYINYRIYKWAGYEKNKALALASFGAIFYTTTKEWIDGHIDIGGFSNYDILANVAGVGFTTIQEYYFDRQVVKLKYSFSPSPYSQYNPGDLGGSIIWNAVRDYNGQTYWLSVPIAGFNKEAPKWQRILGIAAGYGVDGLLSARTNEVIEYRNGLDPIERKNQFYIAPDIHWEEINSESAVVRKILYVLDHLKFPAPALEFGGNGLKFHPIFF